MTLRVRGHHLLCILTYAGRGYTSAFTQNFDAISERLSKSEDILLVEGPDDICSPLLDQCDVHCTKDSVRLRDERALAGLSQILSKPLYSGMYLRLTVEQFARLRFEFSLLQPQEGNLRHACIGCEWETLCTAIAAKGYVGTRINTFTIEVTDNQDVAGEKTSDNPLMQ